jgi:hypothetical protein
MPMKFIELEGWQIQEMAPISATCHEEGIIGRPGMILGQVHTNGTHVGLSATFIPYQVAIEIQEVLCRHSFSAVKPGTLI